MTTLPAWLEQLLTDGTGITPGVRNAKPSRCPKCKAHTLSGLSADWCAFTAHANPTPLNPVGEALAHLNGAPTYALHREGRTYQLHQRDHWQIKGTPAGDQAAHLTYDVIAEHQCGIEYTSNQSVFTPTIRKGNGNDKPPF